MDSHRYFPVAGCLWSELADDPELRGVDDGPPGYGGWRFPRGPLHLHRGIDLPTRIGQPVVAVEAGIAEYRAMSVNIAPGEFNAAGHRVLLHAYSGAGYRYLHLGTDDEFTADAFPIGVRSGDRIAVEAGELIGFAGITGGSQATGVRLTPDRCHLHFGWHPQGLAAEHANPARLLETIGAA